MIYRILTIANALFLLFVVYRSTKIGNTMKEHKRLNYQLGYIMGQNNVLHNKTRKQADSAWKADSMMYETKFNK